MVDAIVKKIIVFDLHFVCLLFCAYDFVRYYIDGCFQFALYVSNVLVSINLGLLPKTVAVYCYGVCYTYCCCVSLILFLQVVPS